MEDSKFVFKKWAKPGLFLFFSEPSNKYIANFDHGKSVNGELGIRTNSLSFGVPYRSILNLFHDLADYILLL